VSVAVLKAVSTVVADLDWFVEVGLAGAQLIFKQY